MHGVDEASEALLDGTGNLIVTTDSGARFKQAIRDLLRERVPATLLGQFVQARPERL